MSTVMTWFTPATSSIPAVSFAAIGFLLSGCLWSPLKYQDLSYLLDCKYCSLLFADKCIEYIHIDLLSSSLSKKCLNVVVLFMFCINQIHYTLHREVRAAQLLSVELQPAYKPRSNNVLSREENTVRVGGLEDCED